MVDLARLENLKRLLNDGTLTREEFEALKQKELQADATDRGSDRGSDCASERSASHAPVIGAPVYGAAVGNAVPGAPGASSTPTLAEMADIFRKGLGVAGNNLVELVEASCVVLGVSVKGKSLAQQADECWRIMQSAHGAHLPSGQASAGACSDSKHAGGMKTTDGYCGTSRQLSARSRKRRCLACYCCFACCVVMLSRVIYLVVAVFVPEAFNLNNWHSHQARLELWSFVSWAVPSPPPPPPNWWRVPPSRFEVETINAAWFAPPVEAFEAWPPYDAWNDSYCHNTSTRINDGVAPDDGWPTRAPRFFFSNEPIAVHHKELIAGAGVMNMEEDNLWMNLMSRPPDSNDTLLYVPGRTLAVTDLHAALKYVGLWYVGLTAAGFDIFQKGIMGNSSGCYKACAMRILTARLSASFESLLFSHHVDGMSACGSTCCRRGATRFGREIVALRGWNISQCPGHVNLSWPNRACDCVTTKWC